ncbi:MAG TPA: NAD(P) transhydrogenase subunit alpha [Kofleriaceae bacterium]|nr:NAD(P) transhydrogenase subunit alpha [Kofleriaceae bacterium]
MEPLAAAGHVQALADVIDNLMVFVLASFLGLGLIGHVSRLLHTPLMSLTNAISSVAMVAALLVLGDRTDPVIITLAVIAVACSATNAVGGFLITDRILKMFRK